MYRLIISDAPWALQYLLVRILWGQSLNRNISRHNYTHSLPNLLWEPAWERDNKVQPPPRTIANSFSLIHWPMAHFLVNGASSIILNQIPPLSYQTVCIRNKSRAPIATHRGRTKVNGHRVSRIRRHIPPFWWAVKCIVKFQWNAAPETSSACKVLPQSLQETPATW